jgi:hypothetical protein
MNSKDNYPSIISFPSPAESQAILAEKMRRRGNAMELICGCCSLPFSEVLNSGAQHPASAHQPQGLTIYSRHYGKSHSNQVKFAGVELVVTDQREFVIVPAAEVRMRLVA